MAHGSGVMSMKNTIRNKYTVSEWDLSEIIGNGGDKNMIKSQKTLQADAVKFAKKYRNVKVTISADAFYKAIFDINHLYENTKSVTGYAMLRYSENTQSNEYSSMTSKTHSNCNPRCFLYLTFLASFCIWKYVGCFLYKMFALHVIFYTIFHKNLLCMILRV